MLDFLCNVDRFCAYLLGLYRQYHDMEKGTNQLLSLPSLQLRVTGVTTGNDNDPRPAIMILSNGFTVTVATVFSLGWSDV